jgi:hypothetical protein
MVLYYLTHPSITDWAAARSANGTASLRSSRRREPWNRSIFSVVVGWPGWVSRPVNDAVVPADPVEQHLPALPEPMSELLAVIGEHLGRTPNWRSAAANARHTARPVARTTTWQITQNRE